MSKRSTITHSKRTAGAEVTLAEDGTIAITYATDTPVNRWGFVEILDISADAIDTTRLDAGAVNILMQHDTWNGLPLGNVIAHEIGDGSASATLRLSVSEEHRGIVENIRAGVYRTWSVGYQILETEETVRDDGVTEIRVTRWMPVEISLVSVPADHAAQTRSADPKAAPAKPAAGQIAHRNFTAGAPGKPLKRNADMKTKAKRTAATDAVDAIVDELELDLTDDQAAAVATMIETAVESVADDAIDAAAEVDEDAAAAVELAVDEALADEEVDEEDSGARAATLLKMAQRHGLSTNFVARHLTSATPISKIRAAVLQSVASLSPAPMTTARARRDTGTQTRAQAETAVYGLLSGRPDGEKAGAFRGMRLIDIARRSLGGEASGRSDREVISLALRSGMHTSSDFSFTQATGSAIERRVREIFASLDMPLQPLVRDTLVSDFKPVSTYSIGGFPELKETAEGAEYEAGSISTESGQFSIAKFGRVLTLSFESIMNDDLRLLDTAIRGAAAKGMSLRNKMIRAAFSAKLGDNKTLFHASRGNLIADALTADGLSKARTALRKVKDLDGEAMSLAPKFLIVGADLETVAQRLVSPITAAVSGEVNPFAGNLELIVDPMLEDGEWIVAADPNFGDAIELADLRGYEGVRVEEIPNHLVDGVSYRARTFAGAHPTGWRGFVKSTGTAG